MALFREGGKYRRVKEKYNIRREMSEKLIRTHTINYLFKDNYNTHTHTHTVYFPHLGRKFSIQETTTTQ